MLKQHAGGLYSAAMLLLLAAGLAATPASAQKMYKWVDEQGNVTYQDQPPPDDAKVLDEYTAPGEENEPQSGAPVTLYSVPQCDACDLVRLLLQKNSVPFTEKNPSSDTAAADELKQRSGQLSVPSLTVGDKLLMGYNSLAIRDELKSAGYQLVDETGGNTPEQTGTEAAPEQAGTEQAAAGEAEPQAENPQAAATEPASPPQ